MEIDTDTRINQLSERKSILYLKYRDDESFIKINNKYL